MTHANASSLITCICACIAASAGAQPQEQPARAEVWDLELGTGVEKLPDAFTD